MHAPTRRVPKAGPRLLLWLLLCAGFACSNANSTAHDEGAHAEGTTAQLAESRSALLGGTFFDDELIDEGGQTKRACSDDDRAYFRQMMLLGRTVALGNAIRDCVRFIMTQGDGTFGPYHPCSNDPYPHDAIERQVDGVLRMLTTPHAVHITCTTGNIGVTRIAGSYDLPLGLREPFDIPNPPLDQLFDANWLSDTAYAAASTHDEADFRARVSLTAPRSALIWHEAMHVHAYRHDCKDQTYFQSVPYMVQYCLQQVAQRSADFCDLRGGCSVGGERALIDSYPITHTTDCECVRDAKGDARAEIPATPVLDQREPFDAFGSALAAGDFDGDGFEDLAVGAPGEDNGTGKVFIYFGSMFGLYAEKTIDQQGLDRNEEGDAFGFSLVAVDLDRDQLMDLVVGAPGEDQQTGAVYVFRGTRRGLEATRALTPGVPLQRGERFGETLAAGRLRDATQPVLAVGSPGALEGGLAGRVLLFSGADEDVGLVEWLAEVRPEAPEGLPGDRLGAALAFGGLSEPGQAALAIGAPADARGGAVYVLPSARLRDMPSTQRLAPAYSVIEARPRGAEADAAFGQALALSRILGPGTLAVGAPKASTGDAKSSGQVSLYRATATAALPLQQLVLDEPDSAAFGRALLSTGRRFLHNELLIASGAGLARLPSLAKGDFDTQEAEYRATLREGPDTRGAAALARGDFDGNGTLDLAIGFPEEASSTRVPSGGSVRVYRRTDLGEWRLWGRYRQGD